MSTHLDLDLFAKAEGADQEERLAALLAILHAHRGWLTRRDLEAQGFSDRELRVLAEHDRDATIFSFPGSPGYKHFDHVTDQEFDRCQALRSQARRMILRHLRYQRRWHRRGKP